MKAMSARDIVRMAPRDAMDFQTPIVNITAQVSYYGTLICFAGAVVCAGILAYMLFLG